MLALPVLAGYRAPVPAFLRLSARVAATLEERQLLRKPPERVEALLVELSGCDGPQHRAAGLSGMAAVAEAATLGNLLDVLERGVEALAGPGLDHA